MSALLALAGLGKEYRTRRGRLRALSGVDLTVAAGECVALVGESGSGKTTLGRCALRLVEPSEGSIRFAGEDLLALNPRDLRRRRRRFQMVFQDPHGSFDPRQRVGAILAEALALHGELAPAERRQRAAGLLAAVGLAPELAARLPHELSGGQRQRLAIARALAPGPELLVADEPVSSLDAEVRGQILELLADLRARLGLALLLIAHDMAAVARLADRIAVLYLGRVVELAPAAGLLRSPLHPYTASLLSAVPVAAVGIGGGAGGNRRRRIVLAGEPPSPFAPPSGCPFHPRCPSARARCAAERPPLASPAAAAPERAVACFYPGELAGGVAFGGEIGRDSS